MKFDFIGKVIQLKFKKEWKSTQSKLHHFKRDSLLIQLLTNLVIIHTYHREKCCFRAQNPVDLQWHEGPRPRACPSEVRNSIEDRHPASRFVLCQTNVQVWRVGMLVQKSQLWPMCQILLLVLIMFIQLKHC